jgi:hypothetical protein
MKKLCLSLLAIILLSGLALAEPAKSSYDLQVTNLYSAQDENSNVVYRVPIVAKVHDISEDGNWYKVEISYNIGPFNYTYVGWAKIPIGTILAEREKRLEKVAKVIPPDLSEE